MYQRLLGFFSFREEQEDYQTIVDTITKGVVFNGTNLWVLVFAIFVASVGLNVNSTAVIIGAMLISPLMGPIMGIGLGLGIRDLDLISRALKNLSFSVVASLITSMLYFVLSPLNEAHSELLARTSPNIYDVLIAFFGGLAGIVATTSTNKGNVLQGVAIATALMPPLCTAGYGLATWQLDFFFGAFYLFIINTVFITLATFAVVRFLNFPILHLPDPEAERRINRILTWVTVLTIVPSIYLGYVLSRNEAYNQSARHFVHSEIMDLENSYVLSQEIDPKQRKISVVIGGADLTERELEDLQKKLRLYDLEPTSLEIKNRLSFERLDREGTSKITFLSNELNARQQQVMALEGRLDSLGALQLRYKQIGEEIRIQYPEVDSAWVLHQVGGRQTLLLCLQTSVILPQERKQTLRDWLKIRAEVDTVKLFLDLAKKD